MTRLCSAILALTLAVAALADVAPERTLPDGLYPRGVSFDGGSFRMLAGSIDGIHVFSVDENGATTAAPVVIHEKQHWQVFPTSAIASRDGWTLVGWNACEPAAFEYGSPWSCELRVQWIDSRGILTGSPIPLGSQSLRMVAIDITATEQGFLVAWGACPTIFVERLQPGSHTPVRLAEFAGPPTILYRSLAIAATDQTTVVMFDRCVLMWSLDGCVQSEVVAQTLLADGTLWGGQYTVPGGAVSDVVALPDRSYLATTYEPAFVVRIGSEGVSAFADLWSRAAIALVNGEPTIVASRKTRFDENVEAVSVDLTKTMAIAADPSQWELDSFAAGGTRKALALYAVNDFNSWHPAFRTFDPFRATNLLAALPPPVALAIEPYGLPRVTLQWSPVPDALRYRIQYRRANTAEWDFQDFPPPETTGLVELPPLSEYDIRIQVETPSGWSTPSSSIRVVTPRPATPEPPVDVTATVNADGSVTIRWRNASKYTDVFGVVQYDGYEVERSQAVAGDATEHTFPTRGRGNRFGVTAYMTGATPSSTVIAYVGGPPKRVRAVR